MTVEPGGSGAAGEPGPLDGAGPLGPLDGAGPLGAPAPAAVRYAAIGDSFTEGVGDELPDGSTRGWADLVAAGLAASRAGVGGGSGIAGVADVAGTVSYANFAVRGRLLDSIVTEQLDAALALSPPPTLVTLNGGGNDMLRGRTDVAALVALNARAVRRCAQAGVRLVLLSGADPSDRLPLGRTVRRRGDALTAATAELAAAHELTFVDVFHDVEIRRAVYWSPDRLHLDAAGHQRVAGLVLAALGERGAARAVLAGSPETRGLAAELRYYREHVVPWVARRLRGRSSGDGRVGKHVEWATITPAEAPTGTLAEPLDA